MEGITRLVDEAKALRSGIDQWLEGVADNPKASKRTKLAIHAALLRNAHASMSRKAFRPAGQG